MRRKTQEGITCVLNANFKEWTWKNRPLEKKLAQQNQLQRRTAASTASHRKWRDYKSERKQRKTHLKCTVLANRWRYAFYIVELRICFHLIDSNLETYTRTLEVIISSNIRFCLTHFFITVIAMFVLEIRDSRCRSAGAMSGILGHEKSSSAAMWKKHIASVVLMS